MKKTLLSATALLLSGWIFSARAATTDTAAIRADTATAARFDTAARRDTAARHLAIDTAAAKKDTSVKITVSPMMSGAVADTTKPGQDTTKKKGGGK
jgi:hypothetical protein